MNPIKTDNEVTVKTTLGELTAAYFDAAFAEFGDEAIAARVSQRLVAEFVEKRRR